VDLTAQLPSVSLTPANLPLELSNITLGSFFAEAQLPDYFVKADASWRNGSVQGQAGLFNVNGQSTTLLSVEGLFLASLLDNAPPEPLASFVIEQVLFSFSDAEQALPVSDVPSPLQGLLGEGDPALGNNGLQNLQLHGTSFSARINSGQLSDLMAGALSLDDSLVVSSDVLLTGVYSEDDAQVQTLDLQVRLPGQSVSLAGLPDLNNVVLQSHSRSDQEKIDYSISGEMSWSELNATGTLVYNNGQPTMLLQVDEIALGQLVSELPSPFAELGIQQGLLVFSENGGELSAEELPAAIAEILADDLEISPGVTLKAQVGAERVQGVLDTTVSDLGIDFTAVGDVQLDMTTALQAIGTIQLGFSLPGMELPDTGVGIADDIAIDGGELIVEVDVNAPADFEIAVTTDASWPSRGVSGSLAVFRSEGKVAILLQSEEILLSNLVGSIPGLETVSVAAGSILFSPSDFSLPESLPSSVAPLRGGIPAGLYSGVQFSAAVDPNDVSGLLEEIGISTGDLSLTGAVGLSAVIDDNGSKLDIELPGIGNLLQDVPLAEEIEISNTLLGIDTRQTADGSADYYVTSSMLFRGLQGAAMIVKEGTASVLVMNVQNLSMASLLGDVPSPFDTLVLPQAIISFASHTLADNTQLPGPLGQMIRGFQAEGSTGVRKGVSIYSEMDSRFAETLFSESLSAIGLDAVTAGSSETGSTVFLRAELDLTPDQQRADVLVSVPTLGGPGAIPLLSELRLADIELGVTVAAQSELEYFASGTAYWDDKGIVGRLGVMRLNEATVAVLQVENLSLSAFVDGLPEALNVEFPNAPLVLVEGDVPPLQLTDLGPSLSDLLSGSVNALGQLNLPEGMAKRWRPEPGWRAVVIRAYRRECVSTHNRLDSSIA